MKGECDTGSAQQPCLVTERDGMNNLNRGPSIDASYQVSDHLAKRFQGRKFLEIDQSERRIIKIVHSVSFRYQTWLPQTIHVSDWLISTTSSPLKPLCQMNRNLVGSIYGRFYINIAQFVPIH
jgi:hypothetical protein